MQGSDPGALIIFALIGFIWLLPILIIISSNKTAGGEKLAWLIAVIFVSWFAWVLYMLLAPIKNKTKMPFTFTTSRLSRTNIKLSPFIRPLA
jgi:succinate-acetate transporter protein